MTKSVVEVVNELVTKMGADNNCTFEPTEHQLKVLRIGVEQMLEAGCTFTEDDVQTLVAGEETKRILTMSKYDGFGTTNYALGEIFNGRCHG